MNKKMAPVCESCGSFDVTADAWAEWDKDAGRFVVRGTFDEWYCHQCDGEATVKWVPVTEDHGD
jgi:hypothetical protein